MILEIANFFVGSISTVHLKFVSRKKFFKLFTRIAHLLMHITLEFDEMSFAVKCFPV